eukprot:scaffold129918_cov37-Tisochrysis_lutea.AAC.5
MVHNELRQLSRSTCTEVYGSTSFSSNTTFGTLGTETLTPTDHILLVGSDEEGRFKQGESCARKGQES